MKEEVQRGNTKLAVKAGFWYVVSSFLIKALAFITTPIFSRLMSQEAFGEFSNYASWQSTLLILTGAELYNTLNPAYYDYKDDYDGYVSAVTISSILLTGGFYLFFLLNRSWIFQIVSIPPQYVHVLFFTLMCSACRNVFLARERTLYQYKSVAAISTVNIVIPTLASVVMVLMAADADRLSARIYGFYLPSAIIGLGCGAVMLMRGKACKLGHCKYAFKLALPLMMHYLTVYLLTSTNTIITKSMMGAEATAVVSIATSVAHILVILFQATTGAVTTWVMDNLEMKNEARVRKGILAYLGVIAVLSGGVMLLAPEVVWILGGREYAAATQIIPGLVLAIFIENVCSIFTIILTYDKNVVKTALYTGIVAAVNIGCKVLLLPIMGIQALPVANIVAYVVLFAINYWLVKKAGYGAYIGFKQYTALTIGLAGVMVVSFLLYKNILLRYGVILLVGVAVLWVLYKNKDKIAVLLKKRKKQEEN